MHDLSLVSENGISYITPALLKERSLFVAFTTRIGGFSKTPYDALNGAFHVGDISENVKKNRRLMANKLGFDHTKLTCAQQAHRDNIKLVEDEEVGAGHESYDKAIIETDGLVTLGKAVPIAMFFADCLPVVLVSYDPKLVAVIHAGYKGLLKLIVSKSLNVITKYTDIQNVLAFLGPSIGPCCYRVESKRVSAFKEHFPAIIDKNENFLDLKKIAIYQLTRAGLSSDRIFSNNFCTYCNDDLFFSFRRDGTTGRQSAIAYISEE
ncbi:MAG: peptidoglycan editing factor PgeF [Actinobacteria bacterium]|nr:MAG: peptidoglycan editing factor PgeF [Actinomycetota bacterium]